MPDGLNRVMARALLLLSWLAAPAGWGASLRVEITPQIAVPWPRNLSDGSVAPPT
jgi:hypothetical protein